MRNDKNFSFKFKSIAKVSKKKTERKVKRHRIALSTAAQPFEHYLLPGAPPPQPHCARLQCENTERTEEFHLVQRVRPKIKPTNRRTKPENKMTLHSLTFVCCCCIANLLLFGPVAASTLDLYKNARLGQRIVQTRYGRLQGLILPLDNYKFLRPIEAFLGVPYATPPVQSNR